MASSASVFVLALIEPPSVSRVAVELATLPLVTRHPSILACGSPKKLPTGALEPLQITDPLDTQVLAGEIGLPDDVRKWLAFALFREGGALIVRGVSDDDLRAARTALDGLLRP